MASESLLTGTGNMDSEVRRSKRTRRLTDKLRSKVARLDPPSVTVQSPTTTEMKVPQPGKMFVKLKKGLVQSFGFTLQRSTPETEGFVIKVIAKGEAAAGCGRLHVGQRVYSLNGVQIDDWTEEEVDAFMSQIDHKLILEVDGPEMPEDMDSNSSDEESQEPEGNLDSNSKDESEEETDLSSNESNGSGESGEESDSRAEDDDDSDEDTSEDDDGMMAAVMDDPRFINVANNMLAYEQTLKQYFVDSFKLSVGTIEEILRENHQLKEKVRKLEEENQRLRNERQMD